MEIIEYDSLPSTNDELKILAGKGAKHFTIVTAKIQTKGRGRYDRGWESAPGNLFISILVEPRRAFSELSLVAGLAVLQTIKKFTSEEIKLKWPNDILVAGKKIAGILLENLNSKIIIGVGINIISSPDYATHLKNADAKKVQEVFLYNFQKYYEEWESKGFRELREEWIKNAAFIGQEISVKLANEEVKGIFEGITQTGELMLGDRIINSGEIYT